VSKFIHSDLGHRSPGDIVEVTLSGSAANVMLLDSSNFSAYKSGRQFRYVGAVDTRPQVSMPRSRRRRQLVICQRLSTQLRID